MVGVSTFQRILKPSGKSSSTDFSTSQIALYEADRQAHEEAVQNGGVSLRSQRSPFTERSN